MSITKRIKKVIGPSLFRILYPYHQWLFRDITIYDSQETVKHILKKKCSVSRFGDGEFNVIVGQHSPFQNADKNLGNRLFYILNHPLPNHIVCIPATLESLSGRSDITRKFMLAYLYGHARKVRNLLQMKHYYDALFTRFYMDYADKEPATNRIKAIKEIWENRNLCIIEGEGSRLGIGNDLFANANDIQRIICPAVNAYQRYEQILQAALQQPKERLILIALGMTATVLAYDLAKEGYQAIDIGHIDIEYEWYKRGCSKKIAVPGKYTNEACDGKGTRYGELNDSTYQKQIIKRIL